MRRGLRLLVLAALLALKPACGGGGSSAPPTGGPLVLPAAVPSLPIDSSPPTVTIDTSGQTDAAAQTALQNALNIGGKIVMTNGGTNRTIVLTATLNMPSDVVTPKTVILDGSDQITLSGNTAQMILELQDMAQLTVQRMKFINARTAQSGAGINGFARVRQVTLINCSFDNCQTTGTGPDRGGGGVHFANGQHTQISNCSFNNCAGSNGGAVNSLGTRLTIINSTFTGNSAFGTGGGQDAGPTGQGGIGGAVYVDNVSNDPSALHQLSVTGCSFISNTANAQAGALFGFTAAGTGSVTIIDRCSFTSNTVTGGQGFSGAVYSQEGSLTLSNSTFTLNQAASSGGAFRCINDSSLIANCTFYSNTAATVGGGIASSGGNVYLVNVTLAQNVGNSYAGGLFSTATSTTITNSIFSGNSAGSTPSLGIQVNEIFGGGANVQAPDTLAAGDKSVTASGTTRVADAMLGPLQNNGGPTFTMRPSAGSPAINLSGVSGAPLLDQRGFGRNGLPDAGACEGP